MASNFTAVNPKIISTPSPQGAELKKIRATNSKTWVRGEIGYLSSGLVQPIANATGGDTAPFYQFAENQSTNTSASDVWVREIPVGARMEIYTKNNATDAAVGNANRGTKYCLYTTGSVTYLNVGVTTNADWEVDGLAADYEPERNNSTDTPGKCTVILR